MGNEELLLCHHQGIVLLTFKKKILFIHKRHTERERQRHRQREKQAPRREPDMGLDPGTPGPHPGLKAGIKPLNHPGIPYFNISIRRLYL